MWQGTTSGSQFGGLEGENSRTNKQFSLHLFSAYLSWIQYNNWHSIKIGSSGSGENCLLPMCGGTWRPPLVPWTLLTMFWFCWDLVFVFESEHTGCYFFVSYLRKADILLPSPLSQLLSSTFAEVSHCIKQFIFLLYEYKVKFFVEKRKKKDHLELNTSKVGRHIPWSNPLEDCLMGI